MKDSPDHLPQRKRDELARIAQVIRRSCDDVEMIILFGSYARGDYKEEADLKPDRKSGHKSDYDVLVVTGSKSTAEDTDVWHPVTAECNSLDMSTHVRIIAHDAEYLNVCLADGQYFFSDIRKEGCLLYDSGNVKLARKRKLKPADQRRIAQDYFDDRFESARGFFVLYGTCMSERLPKLAAFNLNQAAESCYKAILLVFSAYCPQEHLLGLLGEMAAKHDASLRDVFPQETRTEQELFELLDYAYIGARYDPNFRVATAQLEYLSARVKILLELTEKTCKARIASL